jgi:hypothetical protein
LQKILDDLADEKELICKEYNSKFYLASQKNFPLIDESDDKQLDETIEASKIKINELKEIKDKLLNGI